jgi:hypothetical protein
MNQLHKVGHGLVFYCCQMNALSACVNSEMQPCFMLMLEFGKKDRTVD